MKGRSSDAAADRKSSGKSAATTADGAAAAADKKAAPAAVKQRAAKPTAAPAQPTKPSLSVKDFYRPLEAARDDDLEMSLVDKQLEYERLCRQLLTHIRQLAQSSEPGEWQSAVRVLYLQMRRANRDVHFTNSRMTEKLHKERVRADEKHLQLQNAVHEIQHVEKEIQRCLNFRSADEDLDLVSVEQFYAEAPEDVAKPDVTKGDDHEQRLARLNFELLQRKELMQQLADRESTIGALSDTNKQLQTQIDTFLPNVNKIEEATLPLQQLSGMEYSKAARLDEQAHLLPAPLFHLYTQLLAHSQMNDVNLDVQIVGDVGEAKRLMRRGQPADASSDESGAEDGKPSQSSAGGATSQPNASAAKQKRSRRRKSKSPDKKLAKSEVDQREQEMLSRLSAAHPLRLAFTVRTTAQATPASQPAALQLVWLYLTELDTVLVVAQLLPAVKDEWHVLDAGNLLSYLRVASQVWDCGRRLADPVAQQKLAQNTLEFSTVADSLGGGAFGWTQRLCGLKYNPPTDGASSGSVDFLKETLSGLAARVNERVNLSKELGGVHQRLSVKRQPTTAGSYLSGWKRITHDELKQMDAAASLLDGDHRSSGWCFQATVTDADAAAACTAYVHVPVTYPHSSPTFVLLASGDQPDANQIKALESELNGLTMTASVDLLTAQLDTLTQRLSTLDSQ